MVADKVLIGSLNAIKCDTCSHCLSILPQRPVACVAVRVRTDEALIGSNHMFHVFLLADNSYACQMLIRADEALIGCNQILNVFLLASNLVHGRCCTSRRGSDGLQSHFTRVPIGHALMH